MNKAVRLLASMAMITLLSLTGCQSANDKEMAGVSSSVSVKEGTFTGPLAPMEEPPTWTVGSVLMTQDMATKKIYKTVFVKQAGLEVTREREDGCLITRNYRHPFAQDKRWKNCPNPEGSNDNVRLDNNHIWPLKVGNNWSYRKRGGNVEGDKWEDIRSCEVKKQVEVTTQLGTFSAFKVVCENSTYVRTWYMAPAFKQAVKYTNYNKTTNSTRILETVSYRLN